jgi:hypothetical protein
VRIARICFGHVWQVISGPVCAKES